MNIIYTSRGKCNIKRNNKPHFPHPVNQYGESYGPCVLADIVGEEPDLILAVGEDGVEGFVRAEELCADYDVLPDEVVLIPLYDVNGVEIGSFALNSMKES